MPPKKPKLSSRPSPTSPWVDAGAPYPAATETRNRPRHPYKKPAHWAFQPVKNASAAGEQAWVRNPIDAFILARLEGIMAARAGAERGEWLRRVTFDVTGLPPSPEEIAEFEGDPSPRRRGEGGRRLLASPRYGERWAQHWLDVVRFAESEGFEYDRHIPDAWRYRDYVIASLNRDKPFDRFVVEQIAGDEIAPKIGSARRHRSSIASARCAAMPATQHRAESQRGPHRTHRHHRHGVPRSDHGMCPMPQPQVEPISQKDYYRLQAYMAATEEHDINLGHPAERKTWKDQSKKIRSAIQKLQAKGRARAPRRRN